MTAHEAVAALPVSGAASKAQIRALLTRRLAYALATSEDSRNFVVVDPDTGLLPLYLIQGGLVFAYDAADSTTAHDGTTCLVTGDDPALRYKTSSFTYPWSVLDKDTIAQPGSPSIGDRYLIPAAATGSAWSGQDNKVGEYTRAGWKFSIVPIGRPLYVEDETTIYHRNASGVWTAGFGSILLSSNSVRVSNIIGKPVRWFVVNQTTNTPPVSPSVGDTYIIGSSPTGAWAGNPRKIAVYEATSTWTIYTPRTGELARDVSATLDYSYNGSTWVVSQGIWVGQGTPISTTSGSVTVTGSNAYTSLASLPGTGNKRARDDIPISYTAIRAGTKNLKLYYSAEVTINVTQGNTVAFYLAVFRKTGGSTESTALIACSLPGYNAVLAGVGAINGDRSYTFHCEKEFYLDASDASAHDYEVAIVYGATSGAVVFDVSRRTIYIEERAP